MQANGGRDRGEILELQLGIMFEPTRVYAVGLEYQIKNSPDIPQRARRSAFQGALNLITSHFQSKGSTC